MTIRGTGEYLTDGQWITLMNIVCDNKEIDLSLPHAVETDTILVRNGLRWTIHPDGSAHWWVHEDS